MCYINLKFYWIKLINFMLFVLTCQFVSHEVSNFINTDVRIGLQRRLGTKELMLLNCGAGEDS